MAEFLGASGSGPQADDDHYHTSVLGQEVVQHLAPAPGKIICDATLGGGGHSVLLLAAGARVIGLDQDPAALAFARARLAGWSHAFTAIRGNFAACDAALDAAGVGVIDGALLDLGVSSKQLDDPARGFSMLREGPLDMRMDPALPTSAADLVGEMSADELAEVFWKFGEEPASRRIAAHLVRARAAQKFSTTTQLAEAIATVVPRTGRTHPATRVFQALRIAVNRELEVLAIALECFAARLARGGRLAVISFHSGEDKIVKSYFKTRSVEFLDRPEWPAPRMNPDRIFRLVTRKAIVAGREEVTANPRSRSAKLRVVEKL